MEQFIFSNQEGFLFIVRNEGSIREIFNRVAEPVRLTAFSESLLMQDGV
jgi:hypothetical protein